MSDRVRTVRVERVYDGKLLRVDRHTVELPNGATTELEIIEHPGAACALPFVDESTVVLVRQYRHAGGGFLYEAPAGTLEPGEAPEICALREIEEEAGYRADRLVAHGSILTTPGFTDERIWLYEAHGLTSVDQRLEEDEVIEVVTMPFEKVVRMARTGEIDDAKTVALVLRAESARQGV